MEKKLNLALLAFLAGGLTTMLPMILKISVLVASGILLFMRYDEYFYDRFVGGTDND